MRSLYEIAVSVAGPDEIDDPRHCQITIEPAVVIALVSAELTEADQDEALRPFGLPDDAALRDAGRHHAGVLGRVATALTPWLDYTRKQHRCAQGGPFPARWPTERMGEWEEVEGPPAWFESCGITGSGVLTPGQNDYWQPALWITVPVGEQPEWLKRIREALEAVAADAS